MKAIERLYKYLDHKVIKPTVFEKEIGFSSGYLSNQKKRNADLGESVLNKINDYCHDLNIGWLLTGNGSMLKNQKEQDCSQPDDEQETLERQPAIYNFQSDYFNINKQVIPLYEFEASAGLNLLFGNQTNQMPVDYISVPNAPKCDGAMFVRGDSMYPIMKSGDIICYKQITDLQNNLRFGEIYLLYINDGDDEYLTVKYVQVSERGSDYIKLVSQNKYHAPKDEHLSHILGAAIIKLSIRYNTIS